MKLRKLRHILTLALLLCALFCAAPSASAAGSTEDMLQWLKEIPIETVTYGASIGSASVEYSHALLFQDANRMSADLVKASMALSDAAYDASRVNWLLSGMGFSPEDNSAVYERSLNGLTITDCDHVAYTIATKTIDHPGTGEPWIIYCVAIQGTPNDPPNLEWASDFNLGNGVEHDGFRKASQEVSLELLNRFNDDGYDADHRILWITGHSRGAACANLIAGWFSAEEAYVAREHLFAYTFACPAVSQEADTTLTNIFNFNNPGDLIPMLPLPEWGYARYGQTFSLDTSTMCYGNFTLRFQEVMGESYGGNLGNEDFRAVMSEIGKSDDLQKVLDLLGWTLSGGTISDLKTIMDAHSDPRGDLMNELLDEIAYGDVIKMLLAVEDLLTGRDEQNLELMDWAQAAYDATKHLSMEDKDDLAEFTAYKQANSAMVQRLQEVSGATINGPDSFLEAKSRLVDDSSNIVRLAKCIDAVVDLVSDDDGGIADKVAHAHDNRTYQLWINSMFYGFKGWMNNPLLDSYDMNDTFTSLNIGQVFTCDYFSVGSYCFYNCDNPIELTLPDTVTYIGQCSFYKCTSITGVTLPENLVGIGSYNFHGVTGLSEIAFPDSLRSIGDYAFYDCDGLTELNFPNSLRSIDYSAFAGCDGLTELLIPDSVENLGTASFGGCANLRTVTLPCETGYGAFRDVTTLERLHYTKGRSGVMPSQGYKYADNVYEYHSPVNDSNESLKEIIFDEGITHIAAFLCCSENGRVAALTSVKLPSTLESVGEYAFSSCSNAKFNEWPKSLTSIGKYSFRGCNQVTSIPSTVTYFPESCFANCEGLTEITMSDSVTGAEKNAFTGCDNVRTLTMPADFSGYYAFYPMNSLELVHYTKGKTGIMVNRHEGGVYSVVSAGPEFGSQNLKKIIFDEGITHIAAYLTGPEQEFDRRSCITSVVLPSTLESVGNYAFAGCTNAVFSEWPESLTSVGIASFFNCKRITSIPALTNYADRCFDYCSGVIELTIPDNVEKVGKDAFRYCTNVQTLTMPATYSGFDDSCLGTLSNIKTIRYTKGKTGIMQRYNSVRTPEEASKNTLQSVIFEEGIIQIDAELFKRSDDEPRTALTSVTLPSTLENVGDEAFYNCQGIETLSFSGDAPTFGTNTFYNVNTTVYYPHANTTWTEDVRQNYGGELNWVPFACADGHTEQVIKGTAATCGKPGLTDGIQCTLCGIVVKPQEEIPATGKHTEEILKAVDATCTESGLTEGIRCTVCEQTLKPQEVIPAGHKEVPLAEGSAPTCTQNGWTTGARCSVCEEILKNQEEIPATGHTEVPVEGRAPTCINPGLTEGTSCSVCGCTVKSQEEIPASGKHVEVPVEGVAPTCVNPGLTDWSYCAECGVTVKPQESIPATGKHNEEVWSEEYPPTCVQGGMTEGIWCIDCGMIIQEPEQIPATGEHEEVYAEGSDPGCTWEGLTGYIYCSVCGEIIKPQEVIPPSDEYHDFVINFMWDYDFNCIAEFTCVYCLEQITVTCDVSTTITPAEGDMPAQIVHTATATVFGQTYTDICTEDLPEEDQTTHTPTDRWYSDKDLHWKQCTTCDEKLEITAHTPGPEATMNTSQRCTVCDRILRIPLGAERMLKRAQRPDSYLWATGNYIRIMEQYGDNIGNMP